MSGVSGRTCKLNTYGRYQVLFTNPPNWNLYQAFLLCDLTKTRFCRKSKNSIFCKNSISKSEKTRFLTKNSLILVWKCLKNRKFFQNAPAYRRFTVSWVTVKVAWVTFWLSFNNFLWISYWCYAKYFCTTKSGSFSPNHTNFYLIFNS